MPRRKPPEKRLKPKRTGPGARLPSDKVARILRDLGGTGLSSKQIAQKHGTSELIVNAFSKRYGIRSPERVAEIAKAKMSAAQKQRQSKKKPQASVLQEALKLRERLYRFIRLQGRIRLGEGKYLTVRGFAHVERLMVVERGRKDHEPTLEELRDADKERQKRIGAQTADVETLAKRVKEFDREWKKKHRPK